MEQLRQDMFTVTVGLEELVQQLTTGAPQFKEAGGTVVSIVDGEELTFLGMVTALRDKAVDSAKFLEHLDLLRGDPESGDTVELLCDGPDGCRVVCCGDWTGWGPVAFDAPTVAAAAQTAATAKAAGKTYSTEGLLVADYLKNPDTQYVVMPVGLLKQLPPLSQRYLVEAFLIVRQDLERTHIQWPPAGCCVNITLSRNGMIVEDPYVG